MHPVFGGAAKASPSVFLRAYPTLTISLAGFPGIVLEFPTEHPELLGESLIFFLRLYHTYHFPFRCVCVRVLCLPDP